MLLAQIEAFVEIAWQGTMRKASETIHLGQPALSARIVGLEEYLGAPLFDRQKRGMVLTPAGRAYLPHAEKLLEAARFGIAVVRDLESGRAGEVVIGATSAISAYVLPELIARFRKSWPTVRVFVRTQPSEGVAELVLRGDAHVGLVRDHRVDHLIRHAIYEEELALVARSNHPLTAKPTLAPSELQKATIILLDRRWPSTEFMRNLFAAKAAVALDTIEIDNVELAKRLVARGLGVAMIPMTAVASEIKRGDFVQLKIRGTRSISRKVLVLERPGNPGWPPLDDIRRLMHAIPEFVPGAIAVGEEALEQ